MSDETSDGPLLRVVRGDPSAVELAALIAVIGAKLAAPVTAPTSTRSSWGHPSGAVRRSLWVSPGGWRASARPS